MVIMYLFKSSIHNIEMATLSISPVLLSNGAE